MVTVKVLLTEDELRADFVRALTERQLPEKFFYWYPLAASAWLDLCRSKKYTNYARSMQLIQSCAKDVAAMLPLVNIEWISLGCGQGSKEPYFLQALQERGSCVAYFPLDSSMQLLEMACREGECINVPTIGIKADIEQPAHLNQLASNSKSTTRVLSLLGNSLGTRKPPGILTVLREIMTANDYLLVDGEIFSDKETLANYDNPDNRAFAVAPMRAIGLSAEHGELKFELVPNEPKPGFHYIKKHYIFKQKVDLQLPGTVLQFQPGEKIEMSPSYKYDKQSFLDLLVSEGFTVTKSAYSEDNRYVLCLTQ